ncbi:4-(cytidine 5'-diphospho)-2-C-methyl-D-erythritol kinase [Parasphingorhabdus halotolerans]|uniref:4-diphosphocytidyl-2-C-methyl-D-erythritol kinase n=1 Tax=Parasphingorhabdus halotolerans TaxID=2725558 RepID=A0A6H2DPN1_9SPHN|nr:4-(cytidine 5'-diphospho)-2-C-methyl-D-erythritol kinase [Parasphingorhabdus halotolerans]
MHTETAFAKINLALHVRARLPNGYHELETIFAFLQSGDTLMVTASDEISLEIFGLFGEELSNTNNLVLDAAQLMRPLAKTGCGAALSLQKYLPIASGIGGGSADAAATMRLLNRFWGINLPEASLMELAAPLGADVPACISSKTCRATGIGHDMEPIEDDSLDGSWVVLVNPLVQISTAQVFGAWDGVDRGALANGPLKKTILSGRNDLQDVAISFAPEIAEILELLEESDALFSRMSGSGATCFALFNSKLAAQNMIQELRANFPGFWTMMDTLK